MARILQFVKVCKTQRKSTIICQTRSRFTLCKIKTENTLLQFVKLQKPILQFVKISETKSMPDKICTGIIQLTALTQQSLAVSAAAGLHSSGHRSAPPCGRRL